MKRRSWRLVTQAAMLASAFLANACCGPSNYTLVNNPSGVPSGQMGHAVVIIDERFTAEQANLIKSGIDLWVHASRGLYTVRYAPSNAVPEDYLGVLLPSMRCQDVVTFEPLEEDDEVVKEIDARHDVYGARGIGQHNSCDVSHAWLVRDRISTDEFFMLIASHEFGHAIGLKHTDHRGAVMYRSVLSTTMPCLRRTDMVEFCDKFHCDPEEMAWCEPIGGCNSDDPD